MATNGSRLRFTFWLNANKSEENELAERIEELKQERSFTRTIRNGIRLICDLRAGKTDVLLELFPWVREHFEKNQESGYLALKEQLTQLEERLLQEGAVLIDQSGSRSADSNPIRATKYSPSSFDESDGDLITVKAVEAKDSSANQNFINSMLALQ